MTLQIRNFTSLVDGVTIGWGAIGDVSKKPPLVMLHGLYDSSLTWRKIAHRLARDHYVLFPDLPGHGYSDRPDAPYDLSWYAEILGSWIKSLGYHEVDLVGHSLGGGISLTMLVHCRSLIRRLVLVSSGGLGKEIIGILKLASFPYLVERFGQPFMAMGTQIALRKLCAARSQEDIDHLSKLNGQSGSARAFSRTVRHIINFRGQTQTFHQRIHEVTELPPMLVLWGVDDPVIPISHAYDMQKEISDIELKIFSKCGHFLHLDEPDAFTDAILEFVDAPTVRRATVRHPQKSARVLSHD
jgi:pimeloyl-ACP methyl ester carboxylesterase